jgi:hypothetical protein
MSEKANHQSLDNIEHGEAEVDDIERHLMNVRLAQDHQEENSNEADDNED